MYTHGLYINVTLAIMRYVNFILISKIQIFTRSFKFKSSVKVLNKY